MTAEGYKSLAEDFRAKAKDQDCPAFRAELEELARCYEWAASATAAPVELPSTRHSRGAVGKAQCLT
jgi:hypothetical protein